MNILTHFIDLNLSSKFFKYLFLILSIPVVLVAMQNKNPAIENIELNTNSPEKYGLLEIQFDIVGANYTNPFDPQEIDVRCHFFSPTGKLWEIFGFFDEYRMLNKWKIRFAANEVGDWRFVILVETAGRRIESDSLYFKVLPSQRRGWVHVSEKNPNYLQCDDGSFFYGVGMCYPWNVSYSGLSRLAQHGANIFFYWNGTYDGAGNGGGNYLIESINSGLGRYDRLKSGRLDELLQWSDELGIKMFLVIWPHDYLADNLTGGWVNQWSKNPYKEICRAEEFYGNELAWQYQEKLYRYMIARWGWSEALAGWQIVCEITGTDGWFFGHETEAENWSQKVHNFFQQNDPFNHPTTGSQHGYIACDWQRGYEIFDLPNREMYEDQGWPGSAANPLRSSLINYRTLTLGMSQNFAKPAICGETGYRGTPVPALSDEYDKLYHNALWVTLASGMSCTPFWWSYEGRIVSQNMLEQMKVFSDFVHGLEFEKLSGKPISISSEDGDGACIIGDSLIFGWFRQKDGIPIAKAEFEIFGIEDGNYQCFWINPWSGELLENSIVIALDSKSHIRVPDFSENIPDVAFKIMPLGQGTTPYGLNLYSSKKELLANGRDSAQVTCMIVDFQGRLCGNSNGEVHFSLLGPGKLNGETSQRAQNGIVKIQLKSERMAGESLLIAESPGLKSDSLAFQFKDYLMVDDFQSYTSNAHVASYWQIYIGTQTQMQLGAGDPTAENKFLKIDYHLDIPDYAGVFRHLEMDWSQFEKLSFRVKGDNSNNALSIMFKDKNGNIWSKRFTISRLDWIVHDISFHEFDRFFGSEEMDLTGIVQIIFLIEKGMGDTDNGTIFIDGLKVTLDSTAAAITEKEKVMPAGIELLQNYPNPFNAVTRLRYYLSEKSDANFILFNLLGEQVKTIVQRNLSPGWHWISLDGNDLPSGVYLLQLRASGLVESRKILVLK